MNYADARRILQHERLPAVIVDLDAFDRNVAMTADVLKRKGAGHTLRPASKSVRVPALLKRILDADDVYRGVMCYSAEEVPLLAEMGFNDFLVAYPTVQDSDLEVLKRAHENGVLVRLMVDSAAGLDAVNQYMEGVSEPFRVTLDVDMSLRVAGGRMHFGVRRSPVRSVEHVLALYEKAESLKNVAVTGLMAYEAQVAGLGDRNPFKKKINAIAALIRRKSVASVYERRGKIAEALKNRGYNLEIFNGGGTGSLNISVNEPWLTELTVGSGFLCSHLFDYYSNITFEPACFFAVQVVRASDPGFVTCQGGGYIASGEPGWDKVPKVHLPDGLEPVGSEGCGEVQTPLKVPSGMELNLGDPVLFRHAKAGEPAERFREYLLVQGGKVVDRVPTYRGLGWCFF